MGTSVVRNIDWLIGWDASEGRHVYLRHADLAFAGDEITFVGTGYGGPADREIVERETFHGGTRTLYFARPIG